MEGFPESGNGIVTAGMWDPALSVEPLEQALWRLPGSLWMDKIMDTNVAGKGERSLDIPLKLCVSTACLCGRSTGMMFEL